MRGDAIYTEFLLVEKFGTGIYDLPYTTIKRFIQIMHVREERNRQADRKEKSGSHVKVTRKMLTSPEDDG